MYLIVYAESKGLIKIEVKSALVEDWRCLIPIVLAEYVGKRFYVNSKSILAISSKFGYRELFDYLNNISKINMIPDYNLLVSRTLEYDKNDVGLVLIVSYLKIRHGEKDYPTISFLTKEKVKNRIVQLTFYIGKSKSILEIPIEKVSIAETHNLAFPLKVIDEYKKDELDKMGITKIKDLWRFETFNDLFYEFVI